MKKNILMLVVIIFLLVVVVEGVLAQPSVSSVAGSVVDGESVSISGSEFGAIGPTIHKWDDFEGDTHTIGETIGAGPGSIAWNHIIADSSKTEPFVSNSSSKSNSVNFIRCEWDHSLSNKYDCRFYYEHGSTLSPIYVTWYTRWNFWGTYVTDNEKFWRICYTPDRSSPYYRWVRNCANPDPNCNSGWNTDGSDIPWPYNYHLSPNEEEWIRTEFYGVESSVSTSNGTIVVRQQMSGESVMTNINDFEGNIQTRSNNNHWDTILWGDYVHKIDAGVKYYHDYDDIYIADSRARIEIGNNPIFTSCTHREIQIPTVWSDGSITINVNQGSFLNGDAYLFVVDENGDVSEGYPITFGSAINDTTSPIRLNPSPTTNLSSGTTQTTISLTTDEQATCKYSTTPGISYPSMTNTFSTTEGTTHSTLVIGLQDGQNYNYYVRCNDTSNNYNIDDFLISFGVQIGSTCSSGADNNPIDGDVSITELMSYIADWKSGSVTITDLMTGIGEWKNGC